MKKNIILFLVLISTQSFTQNYKMFDGSSKKLFSNFPVQNATYSLAFDSVRIIGSDSVYYNFFKLRDSSVMSINCSFWAGPACLKQDQPTWAGIKIEFDNNNHYRFYTRSGDTLNFIFNTDQNDTILFYKDLTQKFYLVYQKSDTITVINSIDSSRFYTIIHTDFNGNIIPSQLNQQKIIISKNRGLVRFFQIDDFPQILNPLVLVGNSSPVAGIVTITNEMLYDYEVGDELQYHEFKNYTNVPYGTNYDRYRKHTILGKTVTPDIITYNVLEELFNTGSIQTQTTTITLSFNRNTVVRQIPFEIYDGYVRQLNLVNYYGFKLWTYQYNPNYDRGYCVSENCWGIIDVQGPPPTENYTFVLGLGDYGYTRSQMPPVSGYEYKNMVYFKKDGIICGNQIFVGMDNYNLKSDISIFPNPTTGFIKISASAPMKIISVYDLQGKLLLSEEPDGINETIDLGLFQNGIYFARFTLTDNSVVTKMIMISKD